MSNISFENFMTHEPLVRATILSTKNEMLKDYDFNKLHSNDDINRDYFITVREECIKNIWFFFREIARVPSIYHKDGKQFELTEMSFSLILAYTHGVDFISSSIFPQSQIRETLILLALYEFVCSSKSSINKTINILVANEADKKKIEAEIGLYGNLLSKTLPEFLGFKIDCYRYLKVYTADDIDKIDKCDGAITSQVSLIRTDEMRSILKQNLYVFDYTHMSEKDQFRILECMYKYWHNNKDRGRLIIAADANDFTYGSPVTSFIYYMIDEFVRTDEVCGDPFLNGESMSEVSTYGGMMHISESVDFDNDYQQYMYKEALEK